VGDDVPEPGRRFRWPFRHGSGHRDPGPPPIRSPAAAAETVSRIGHELKNPLASIRGLATTGVKLYGSMTEEERLEFFRLIDLEAARLGRLIDQAATAMRIQAGSLRYDVRPEDLGRLVRDVAEATAPGDHPLEVDAEPGIVVQADRGRLSETLEDVLDNAARFSPPDAPIEVRVARGGDVSALLEVCDRGPGVPPEHREGVFEMFASWRPAGYEETPGAGLGLFIARSHVLAMGGRMDLEGRDGGGTMLRITLPGEG
jgi:signal transduction histidine kinase